MKSIFKVNLLIVFLALSLLKVNTAYGQSDYYKISKNLELQYNILQALSRDFVDTVNFERILKVGIDAMLDNIDPYTEFVPKEESESIEMLTTNSYGGVGTLIRKVDSLGVVIVGPQENSPAVKYGLEVGDVILEIDGEDVKALSADECSKKMRGVPGTIVKFKVLKGRSGEIKEINLVRGMVHVPDLTYYGILKKSNGESTDIGYLLLSGFTLGVGEEFRQAVAELKERGAKRIVIDLRGNGGGVLDEAVDVVSAFVPKGSLIVKGIGRGEGTNFDNYTTKEPIDTQIPVMVLVNNGSASASEVVAGALQDLDRGFIAGTRTFGKGLVQTFRDVGYGGRLKLTISKYYTPSGRCIQAKDYSKRNADGSVASVPDSLKKAFKTLVKGRTVYDGGGITPDSLISSEILGRVATSLAYSGYLDDYAVEFYKKNKTIASPGDFSLTDAQYEDFVKFIESKDVDCRTAAEVSFDQMVSMAKEENVYEQHKAEYESLAKQIRLSKADALRLYKKEIKFLVEREIVEKYYFGRGAAQQQTLGDQQLWNAIDAWNI